VISATFGNVRQISRTRIAVVHRAKCRPLNARDALVALAAVSVERFEPVVTP
jgi:hypothetical protein